MRSFSASFKWYFIIWKSVHHGLSSQFTVKFHVLAAKNSWNKPALIAAFRNRLTPAIQTELACRDEGKDPNSLVALAITLDQHLRGKVHRASSPPAIVRRPPPLTQPAVPPSAPVPSTEEPGPEPMQLGYSRLNSREHQRHISEGLCIYCASRDHCIHDCHLWPAKTSRTRNWN